MSLFRWIRQLFKRRKRERDSQHARYMRSIVQKKRGKVSGGKRVWI